MTSITLSASVPTLAPQSTAVTVARAGGAVAPDEAPASTVVRLRQGDKDIGASTYTQSGVVTDAISTLMARNLGQRGDAGPFADVGAAVLNRFRTEGGNLSLWSPALAAGAADAANAADAADAADAVQAPSQASLRSDNDVSLRIITASGVKVEITLQQGREGMSVQVEVADGTLSEDERRAIADLSGAFQDALDGLAETPPRWSLAKLGNAASPLLSSVSLRDTRLAAGAVVQSIDFTADSSQRTLSVSGLTGVAKVSVDLSKPITLGSAEQQSAAIGKYLQQFDRAQKRGAGDEALVATFKDVFAALHGSVGAAQVPAAVTAGGAVRLPTADAHRSLLSGLTDFSASIEQVRQASNPAQLKEIDGFSFQASQSSSVTGQPRWDLAVSQTQESALTASFHRSLTPQTPLELTSDKASQTYRYVQIHDTTRSQTNLAYEEGTLASASLSESRTQTTQVATYIKGKLVDHSVTPLSDSHQRELLSLVRAAKLEPDPDDTLTPRDQAVETLRRKYLDLARSVASLRQD